MHKRNLANNFFAYVGGPKSTMGIRGSSQGVKLERV